MAQRIQFECPHCKTVLRAKVDQVGKRVACRACGKKIRIPEPDQSVDADAETERAEAGEPGWWGIRKLVNQLKHGSVANKIDAAQKLGALDDPDAVRPLLAALGDGDLSVRRAVVRALKTRNWATTVRQRVRLALAAQQFDEAVALGSEAVEPLTEALEDDDPVLRRGALRSLGRLGDRRAVGPVLEALANPETKAEAAVALGRLRDATAVDPLIEALHDAACRKEAALALGRLGDRRAAVPLIGVLHDEDPTTRANAARALGVLADRQAIGPLIEALRLPLSRVQAADALRHIADPRAQQAYSEFRQMLFESVTTSRRLFGEVRDVDKAKIAVSEIKQLLESSADLLPAEDLVLATRLDDIYARPTIAIEKAAATQGEQLQPVRCRPVNELGFDELARRNVDPKNWGESELRRGTEFLEAGDYDRAVEEFDETLRLCPTCSVALNNRGVALQAKGRLDDALADYAESLALDPTAAAVYANRGDVHAARGRLEQAIADYTEAIRIEPTADHYAGRGQVYVDLHKYAEALADLSKAIELDPQAGLYGQRGVANFCLGRYEQAVADFTRQIERAPDANVYFNRGYARLCHGDYRQASDDFSEAMRLDPSIPRCYRGAARLGLRDHRGAIEDFEHDLQALPDATAHYNLGYARHMMGEPDEALAHYDAAIRLNPKNAAAYNNRGVLRRAMADHERALGDFADAIRLGKGRVNSYVNRGVLHRARGAYSEAIADYDEAIRVDSENPVANYNRCVAHLVQGRTEQAKADFARAVAFDPTLARIYGPARGASE